MLDKARAEELADGLDLERVFACPACLCYGRRSPASRIGLAEVKESLFAAVIDARMREVRFAEEVLRVWIAQATAAGFTELRA
jgi:hypothetical protein